MAEIKKRKRDQLPDFIGELREIGDDLKSQRLSIRDACARMGVDFEEVAAESKQQREADRCAATEYDVWLLQEWFVLQELEELWQCAPDAPGTAEIQRRIAAAMRATAERLLDERRPAPGNEAEQTGSDAVLDWQLREREMVGALEDLLQSAPRARAASALAVRSRLSEALTLHAGLLEHGGVDRGKAAAAVAAAELVNAKDQRRHARRQRARRRQRLAVALPQFIDAVRRVADEQPSSDEITAAAVRKLVVEQVEVDQWPDLCRALRRSQEAQSLLADLPLRARRYLSGGHPDTVDWCERRYQWPR